MNTNEARAWKRNRYSQDDDNYFYAPGNDTHVMMKTEAKVMRRLQAETGLSEEDIRKVKKYRKLLSATQQNPVGPSREYKLAKRLLKGITRELKLAKEHPDVVKAAMDSASSVGEWGYWGGKREAVVSCMKSILGK